MSAFHDDHDPMETDDLDLTLQPVEHHQCPQCRAWFTQKVEDSHWYAPYCSGVCYAMAHPESLDRKEVRHAR